MLPAMGYLSLQPQLAIWATSASVGAPGSRLTFGSRIFDARLFLCASQLAPLLACSIAPFALFGRRLTIGSGEMPIPIGTLGLRHLADDKRSRGQLLAVTLKLFLALPW